MNVISNLLCKMFFEEIKDEENKNKKLINICGISIKIIKKVDKKY